MILPSLIILDSQQMPSLPAIHEYYSDVIMSMMASQMTGVSIVCSAVCLGTDQRKHQSSASLAFVSGEFPAQKASNAEMAFDDVIMNEIHFDWLKYKMVSLLKIITISQTTRNITNIIRPYGCVQRYLLNVV